MVALFSGPGGGLAHGGGPHAADLWSQWNTDPLIWAGLLLAALLYSRGTLLLWRRAGMGRGVSVRRAMAFGAGMLALFAALVSPVDVLAEALFSFHMLQHLLLAMVAAPLLAWGWSWATLAWALPRRWRGPAAGGLRRFPGLERALNFLLEPAPAWVIQSAVLWLWHAPGPYQAALESEFIHAAEHMTILAAGLLYWASMLRLAPRAGASAPRRAGAAILSAFTMALAGGFLGALITFAAQPWYPAYAEPPEGWRFSALEDQQIAGAIMWVPTGVVYLGAVLWIIGQMLAGEAQPERSRSGTSKILLLAFVPALALAASACGGGSQREIRYQVENGDAQHGARLIQQHGCHACHTIPGIPGAIALVGPPLNAWADRQYIAGALANNPDNLIAWIQDPQAIEPGTIMPDMDIGEKDARDIAAYLFTLEQRPRTIHWSLFGLAGP